MTVFDRVVARVARAAVQTRMTKPVSFTSRGGSTALVLDKRTKSWSNSAVAYRCVTAISSNAGSLRLQVRRENGETIEGHELARAWENPNPLLSRRVFGEFIWQRLETKGEQFLYLDRGDSGTGTLSGMWPIFGHVTVVVDKNLAGEVLGYEVDVSGRKVFLLSSEVLWLRYPDAENEWGHMSPLGAAAHAIGLDAHARAWQEGELRNGARPSAVVYLGDLDEEQHERIVDSYRARIEGAHNAGRTLFVSSAQQAKVERMSLTPAELGWLDTRRTSWEEIMLAFGVPKDYLMGGATYENRAASRSTLWADTIINKLELVAGEIARQTLAPGEIARFDTDDVDALQESADAKSTRTVAQATTDLVTIDEGRAELGLDPLEGGMGVLTLSAYRMLLQLQASQQLVATQNPRAIDAAARLSIPFGQLTPGVQSTPLALGPPPRTRAGLGFDDAQAEYGMHERLGAKAIKRLAAKQEQIVLRNLHKLFGRGGQWATKRDALLEIVRAINALEPDAERGELDTQLRAQVDDLLEQRAAQDMTRAELEAFLTTVWSRGAEATAKGLGVSFSTFEIDVLLAMDARNEVLADQVTATTRRVLEDRVLLQGVANGESVDELAARVRATYTDLSTWRATTIARTETVGGFNHASWLTAQNTNLVAARVWLATGDKRTRDTHVDLDEYRVTRFDQAYPNGCRFPGDPMGPPSETIMCRCVEQYEPTD